MRSSTFIVVDVISKISHQIHLMTANSISLFPSTTWVRMKIKPPGFAEGPMTDVIYGLVLLNGSSFD